jgi:Putative Ig domain
LTVLRRALLGRGTWLGLLAATSTLLWACSGSSASPVTGQVGTTTGTVSLSSSNGTSILQQGTALIFSATVTPDPTSAGVTWTLSGVGTLSNITKTSVTYTAPTGITGSVSPILTATSVVDKTQTNTALLVVLGTPVIDPTELFPANVASLYTAQITVSGGLAPFTWALTGGTLPPGLTLGVSTTSFTTISGTPTTIGSYSFQVTVTDANKKVASVDLSMIVKATAACLLEGPYAALYSGYVGGQVAVGGTGITISSAGAITGYHDFNPGGTTISESVSGVCATRTANNGTTQIIGAANTQVYNYAMTTALINGRVQLINGGSSQSGSGPLEKQTPADFLLAKLAGNFAFGALGSQTGGTRTGLIGAITVDGSGHVTSGHADSNGDNPLTDAALTGSLTGPDPTTGRGTLTLTASGTGGTQTVHFAYYIVTADRLFIASLDSSLPIAGFMTRQVGPFSSSSLSNPGILSLWGATGAYQPKTVVALGRVSGADPGSGTVNLVLDSSYQAIGVFGQTFNGGIYAVRAADGRTTMTFTSGVTTRSLVLYLDGPANGYVVEPSSSVGNAGLLEAQFAGPYDAPLTGLFVGGTQFPEDSYPIILMPAVRFSGNSFNSAAYASGFYSLDASTGRGVGTLNTSGNPITAMALYILRPDKVLTLQMATQYSNASIWWMTTD